MAKPATFASVIGADTDLQIFANLLNTVRPGFLDNLDGLTQVRTVLAPSDQAFLTLAQSLGLVGSDKAAAASHIIASLSTTELDQILDIGFARQAFEANSPPKVVTGLSGQYVLSKAFGYVDGDADTPNAMVLRGGFDITPNGPLDRHLHIIDSVLLPFELVGNDGFVAPSRATDGADNLTGDSRAQTIDLLGGDDIYFASGGNDVVIGGEGDDMLNGQFGDDRLFGARGQDSLSGGWGDDSLMGGGGEDRLNGNQGNDFIKGGGANDLLGGGIGNDHLDGGNGNDRVHGGEGDDVLFGDDGDDRVIDGRGNSILNGGRGNDVLKGGADSDTFVFGRNSGRDHIQDFEDGIDLLDLSALGLVGLADLTFTQTGQYTVIDISPTASITLKNVLVADLDSSDFLF